MSRVQVLKTSASAVVNHRPHSKVIQDVYLHFKTEIEYIEVGLYDVGE